MKRIVLIAMILMLAGAAVGFTTAQREGVKVGTLMTYTGALREFGPAIHNGAALAASQLTEAGLLVDLLTEDTETNPIAAVNAARKLVDIDRVDAIVGALASSSSISVAESVTVPAGVVQI